MLHLNIALIQSSLFWENPAANRAYFDDVFHSLSDNPDLIILPEMFTSGFTMKPANVAETMEGDTVKWMKERSRTIGSVLTGSIVIRDGERNFNRLIWAMPTGEVVYYDKRHRFSMAGEDADYTAGENPLVIEWKGWQISPFICYDLRFPAWSRQVAGVDLMIYVANWPETRRHHWQKLLQARAIENQCFVAGVNRVGTDDNGLVYAGDSMLIDFNGEPIRSASRSPSVLSCSLDKDALQEWRQRMPFLRDRDTFSIS